MTLELMTANVIRHQTDEVAPDGRVRALSATLNGAASIVQKLSAGIFPGLTGGSRPTPMSAIPTPD